MKSININFDSISSEGRDVEVSINKDVANALLRERGEDGVWFEDAVTGSVNFKRNGKKIDARGKLASVANYECVRCTERFTAPFALDFSATLAGEGTRERVTHAEVELADADLEVIHCPGDTVDLAELVMEEAILAFAQYPLCKEDCEGICPECGKNKNAESCACSKKAVDPRLAALLKLKKG